jgi:hypothetical protein
MKKIITVTTLFAALSYVGIASAHSMSGSLGAKATAVDVYKTTCSKDPATGTTGKFLTKVKAVKKGVLVSVKASKGKLGSNTTDTTGGDAKYSPDGIIKAGGEGVYSIFISKSGAGAMNYVVEAHCQTTTGKHTKQTEPVQTQNQ